MPNVIPTIEYVSKLEGGRSEPLPDDAPVSELGLDGLTKGVLTKAGLKTVGDVRLHYAQLGTLTDIDRIREGRQAAIVAAIEARAPAGEPTIAQVVREINDALQAVNTADGRRKWLDARVVERDGVSHLVMRWEPVMDGGQVISKLHTKGHKRFHSIAGKWTDDLRDGFLECWEEAK